MIASKDPPAREASSCRKPETKLISSQLRYLDQRVRLTTPVCHFNAERTLVEPKKGFEALEVLLP
jgi:hypothetical protein